MAKNSRVAVTVRGMELLTLIAAAGDAGLMLTQDEGAEAVTSGDAIVDTSVVDGDTAKVTLTDQGRAKLTGNASAPAATPVKPSFTMRTDIAPPTAKRGGKRDAVYPFDQMEVNQSFHIPKTAENPDPAEKVASSVSGARAKYAVKSGETETVKTKTYAKDAAGKFIKGADGKRVVSGEGTVTRDKMTIVRDFIVRSVGAEDPDGVGARVWRTK